MGFHHYVDFLKPHYEKKSAKTIAMVGVSSVKKENSSNKVIGIKEISHLLDKQCNLEEAKELIAIKTRQYAKRQATWARGQMQSWQKIDPKNLSLALKNLK